MYAGTNYGSLHSHPLQAYHLGSRPLSASYMGIGFIAAGAAPAIAASGPAAPFVAAALIAAPFVAKIMAGVVKGCGSSCELTSDAANQVEQLLQKNLQMYQASGRTQAEQEAALYYFDTVWNQLVEFCGQPEFQKTKAGKNCVADRREGACKWKGADGQCWNWFIGYRNPIANDADVKPNASVSAPIDSAIESAGQSIIDSFSGKDSTPLLLIAGLVGVVLLLK